MGFYNRMGGYGRGEAIVVANSPASVGPGVPAADTTILSPPAGRFTIPKEIPVFPIGPRAPETKFLSLRPVESLGPVSITGKIPGPAQPLDVPKPTGQTMFPEEQKRDAKTKAASMNTSVPAPVSTKPTGQTMLFPDPGVPDPSIAAKAAATKKADDERIAKAAADALAESTRAQKWNEANPSYPSGGGGGGGGSSSAAQEQLIEVPLTEGGTAGVVVSPSLPLLTIAAAGAGGFLVLGPVGALLGAAAGFFLAPKKAAAKIAYYR